ncbi:MAG: GNAT family N-acetyltransferase [Chitinophagaceae bacterium]
MHIRSCTLNDIDTLVTVSVQSYNEHYNYLWLDEGENYISKNFTHHQLEKELHDNNSAFFIINDDTGPIGIIKINIDKTFEKYDASTAMELERLYLIKQATGKGYGQAALNFSIDFARKKNKTILWLKTMENSAAAEFYKKQGFIIASHTELNYPFIRRELRKMLILSKHLY